MERCSECGGSGTVECDCAGGVGSSAANDGCPACGGSGSHRCPPCGGSGEVEEW